MFAYLKNSNVKLAVDLNPFVWRFKGHHQAPTKTDPKLHIFFLVFLFLTVIVVIDDGTYISWEELIVPMAKGEEEGGDTGLDLL